MRGILCALPIAFTLMCPTAAAQAAPPPATLTAAPLLVHTGDVVTVTGTACPTGHHVTHVLQQTLGATFAKGVPPFVPLDLQSIDLVDTAQGVSFEVTAETPRTTLSFRVDCSDGTTATSADPVTVQPPPGEFWWGYNTADGFVTEPGAQLWFTARTWECIAGSTARGTIATDAGDVVVGPLSTEVGEDGLIEFDIVLGASLEPGTYTGTITCNSPTGTLTNSTSILVLGADPPMPLVGGGTTALTWLAVCLVAIGLILRLTAGRMR